LESSVTNAHLQDRPAIGETCGGPALDDRRVPPPALSPCTAACGYGGLWSRREARACLAHASGKEKPVHDRAARPTVRLRFRLGALVLTLAGAAVAGGCGSSQAVTPSATPLPASGVPSLIPSPGATITVGPVPPAAAHVAQRYWQLVDRHRYGALLAIVTPDSNDARAIRDGTFGSSMGITRVDVVSIDPAVGPAPPTGATVELTVTVDITPAKVSAWSPGRRPVFMSLRQVGGAWLVDQIGSGP
jgi:hypothetical protein